jgi:hypothetical protein
MLALIVVVSLCRAVVQVPETMTHQQRLDYYRSFDKYMTGARVFDYGDEREIGLIAS